MVEIRLSHEALSAGISVGHRALVETLTAPAG
jgi:hypothetical protein